MNQGNSRRDDGVRPKPKAVYGTRQSTILRSAPRRHELFVFRVDKEIADDSLKDYLTEEGKVNKIHELKCVSLDNSWTKSYRVLIECKDVNDILSPDFWPDGIGCRRFWRKRSDNKPL